MISEEIQYDIKVVNAFKSYGSNSVINGLYMNVQSGSIYGLLGSSGCGKSTLLQCILGEIKLDSGSVDLKAEWRSDIGYMPQDLCLEDSLTIKEIFEFYGAIYGMSKSQIKLKTDNLSEFLQLPDINQCIKQLSGGQSRRVSLGVSLFHDPKIIILDEPTVGIDPLLRQRIWEEFSKMVLQHKTTIIITTHYIEEAALAGCVGLMRNGVLVEEGSPQYVLTKYKTDSLESAFLTLCCKQEDDTVVQNEHMNINVKETTQSQPTILKKSGKTINTTRIIALLKKNIQVFFRDYLLMGIIFLLPIIQTFNICLAIGKNINDIRIAVVNDEINFLNCQHSNISECIINETSNQSMSCVTMNRLLSYNYKLVEVKDRNTGELMLKNYQSLAFFYFPHNYTKDLIKYAGNNRKNYNFKSPIYVDYARDNYLIRNQILKDTINSVKYTIEKMLYDCSNNPRSLNIPMDFKAVVGKEVKLVQHSLLSFFISMGIFFLGSSFSVSLMLGERMDGLLSRSMFAGVSVIELLISLFCITTVVLFISISIPIFLAFIIFSNPIQITSGLVVYGFVMFLIGWIGFVTGITLAGLFSTKLGAVIVSNGLFLSQFLLCGFIWPIEGQTYWMKQFSKWLPPTIVGATMNNIALKGWEWNHPIVINNTIILIVYFLLLVLILIGLGKVKKDMWVLRK